MKARLAKLLSLRAYEVWDILESCFWLLAAKCVLAIFPYRLVDFWIRRISLHRRLLFVENRIEIIVRSKVSLYRALRALPLGFSCLNQAVAGRGLLYFRGVQSDFCLGVRAPNFEAHAWLKSEGLMVVGGEEASRFDELTVIR